MSILINEDKIHPIKRRQVKRGIVFLDEHNQEGIIKKVILFGSTVTDHCTETSDIDLCFVTSATTQNPEYFQIFGGIPLIMDESCDIVIYADLHGK